MSLDVTCDFQTIKGIALSWHLPKAKCQFYFCLVLSRACEALCQCLPDQLKDDTFAACLKDDKSTKHWLAQLLKNLQNMAPGQAGAGGGSQQPASEAGGGMPLKPPVAKNLPGAL